MQLLQLEPFATDRGSAGPALVLTQQSIPLQLDLTRGDLGIDSEPEALATVTFQVDGNLFERHSRLLQDEGAIDKISVSLKSGLRDAPADNDVGAQFAADFLDFRYQAID